MTKLCGVYQITDLLNSKVYIGQSDDIERRIRSHFRSLLNNRKIKSNPYFQHSFNKHKMHNFSWRILELCDVIKLNTREQYWMDKKKAYIRKYGYNIAKYAEASHRGIPCSDNAKQLLSDRFKGRHILKHLSKSARDKWRRAISNTMKGRVFTKQHCTNISKAKIGYDPYTSVSKSKHIQWCNNISKSGKKIWIERRKKK